MSTNNPNVFRQTSFSEDAPKGQTEDDKLAARTTEYFKRTSGQEAEEAASNSLKLAGSKQLTDRQQIQEIRTDIERDPVQTTLLEELRKFADQSLLVTNQGELDRNSLQAIDLLLASPAARRIVGEQRFLNDLGDENLHETSSENAQLLADREKRVQAGVVGTYTKEEYALERERIEQKERRGQFSREQLDSYKQIDPDNPVEYRTIRGLANRIIELARELQDATPEEQVPPVGYKVIERPTAFVEATAQRDILVLSALVGEYKRRHAEVSRSKFKALGDWWRTKMGDN